MRCCCYLHTTISGSRMGILFRRTQNVITNYGIEASHCAVVVNSSPPNAANMRQWIGSALVQVMACRLFGVMLWHEPILTFRQLVLKEQTIVKFKSKYTTFHLWKCIWKCHWEIAAILSRGRWVNGFQCNAVWVERECAGPYLTISQQSETILMAHRLGDMDEWWIAIVFIEMSGPLCLGWVGLWGFLWWAPSAKGKDHHGVSSGWSSVWHRSNTGLSSTQYEQIPIILGIWPFWLTPFFFRSITFWWAYG